MSIKFIFLISNLIVLSMSLLLPSNWLEDLSTYECLPVGPDSICSISTDCCSENCHRDDPDSTYGVCQAATNVTTYTCRPPPPELTANPPTYYQNGSGECSWYGMAGEVPAGNLTSCGDVFDRHALTVSQLGALEPRLPCGTMVRVTNDKNGACVDVKVNDLGTYPTRILDLSYQAFGMIAERALGHIKCSYIVL